MILAISRFRVANDKRDEVEQAFLNRPCLVDSAPGFIGLEVFTNTADPAAFHLFTRWTDLESFHRWHSSPAHTISHQGIPKGLKLDPSQTELLFLKRVDGVDAIGRGVLDWSEMLDQFIGRAETVCYIAADRSGTIQVCSRGFASAVRMLSANVIGASVFSFLSESSRAALVALLDSGERRAAAPAALAFDSPSGASFTLECQLDIQPAAFALIGCVGEQRTQAYMETLENLNNQLAVEIRESARKGKELERVNGRLQQALDELDNMYWHLRKIQEVLPICLHCGKVKTGDGTWQTVVDYLKANSQFLSHGYCPDCYAQALAEQT
jgi:heme-degrading monooxygenase HmoA